MNVWECILLAVIAGIGLETTAQRTNCPSLSLKNGKVRIRQGKMAYFRCRKKFTRVGAKLAVCLSSGTWSQQTPVCVDGISLGCDFEDSSLCGWIQDANDDFDWTWTSGTTPTTGTGPEGDHTTGKGHYIYMESSAPQKPGWVTRLISPPYGPTEEMCLTFFYHMQGPDKEGDVGDLDVYVRTEDATDDPVDVNVFHQEGNQGSEWLRGNVVLPRQQSVFSIVFAATRRESWTSDIALDDISVFKCSERHLYEQSPATQRTTAMLEGSSFETSSTIDYFESTTMMNPSQPQSTVPQRRMSTTSQPRTTTSAKASITDTTPDTPDTPATPTSSASTTTTTTTTSTTSPTTTTTSPTTTTTTTTTTSPTTTTTTTSTTPAASSAATLSTPATTSLSETAMTTIPTTKEMTEKGILFSTFTTAEEGEVSTLTKVSRQNEGSTSQTEVTSTMTTSFVTDRSSVTTLCLDNVTPSLPTGSDALNTDESSGTGDALDKTTRNQINDKDDADHSSRNNNSVAVNEDRIDNFEDYISDNGNDEGKSGADNAQATESGASSTNYLPLIVGVTLGLAVGMAVISVLAWMWARNRRKQYERQVEEDQQNIIGSIEGNPYQQ
ncbi:hypothetical protein C0Q70_04724 [Pomacea canaliculata]|uniref:Sushi domain-containing protein n=1 Tax=Pomacea canaliculata TaxID=400727 RepID=A0A2T7PJ68_POMCA|nr:hypothetical protein C0Q70_04724 [Pomacea canaliculata]